MKSPIQSLKVVNLIILLIFLWTDKYLPSCICLPVLLYWSFLSRKIMTQKKDNNMCITSFSFATKRYFKTVYIGIVILKNRARKLKKLKIIFFLVYLFMSSAVSGMQMIKQMLLNFDRAFLSSKLLNKSSCDF